MTYRRRRNLSTSTVSPDGRVVPWLAATGPLAYSPEKPPDRDYYFQYSWVLPAIFAEGVNRRRHYFFGARHRDDARELFDFWADAREGRFERIALCTGTLERSETTAPMAVYRPPSGTARQELLFIQHGSYQFVQEADQPSVAQGEVYLYRGLQEASTFRLLDDPGQSNMDAWQRYLDLQAHVLADSVRSFIAIHDRTKRCETSHVRDQSWITDEWARGRGLRIDQEGWDRDLWRWTRQSFSLARWVARNKFGPNYVVCRTPLDNLHMTTFFAGEQEVRIIDPRRVKVVESHGCAVDIGPVE